MKGHGEVRYTCREESPDPEDVYFWSLWAEDRAREVLAPIVKPCPCGGWAGPCHICG